MPKNLLDQPFSIQERMNHVDETLMETNKNPNLRNFKRILPDGTGRTRIMRINTTKSGPIPRFPIFPKPDCLLLQEEKQLKKKQEKIAEKSQPKALSMKRVVGLQEEEPAVIVRELSPVNIKEEPRDKIIMQTTIKTEPIDYDDNHIPEFPLTIENTFDMPENLQNVIIKEEYEIEDEVMVADEVPMNEADIERRALLEKFSTRKSLVIKSNIKKKIEKKKMTEQKRKMLAISIPEDATIVEDFVMKETTSELETEPQTSNIQKLLQKKNESDSFRYTKFKCEHCTVVSRSRALVIRHIKEMHAFKCTVCLLIFPTNYKLAKHQENTHNIIICEDGGRRKQKLFAKKEEVPAAFRMHT